MSASLERRIERLEKIMAEELKAKKETKVEDVISHLADVQDRHDQEFSYWTVEYFQEFHKDIDEEEIEFLVREELWKRRRQ